MKVIIVRGISGAGKSTFIKDNYPDTYVCSADSYFMNNGKYKFDPTKLNEAHSQCMNDFINGIINENKYPGWNPIIIVDNTNTKLFEISPYILVARAYNIEIEIIRIQCDPEVAYKRNTHGVPLKTIISMHKRMEDLPSYWPKEKFL